MLFRSVSAHIYSFLGARSCRFHVPIPGQICFPGCSVNTPKAYMGRRCYFGWRIWIPMLTPCYGMSHVPFRPIIELFRPSSPNQSVSSSLSKVHDLGARLSQHSREAEERMRSMDDATRNMLMASTATKSVDAGGTDISFPAGREVIYHPHNTLALPQGHMFFY